MGAPALSVITVVRDDPEGLAATRDSLAAQSWRDFEWLVADGGSAPATLAVLAEAAPDWLDSRPDGGPFAGMDRALAVARGTHVLFLNAGDCLADGDVLARIALLLAGRPDLLYGDSLEDPGDGRMRRKPARHCRWAFYGMPAHHCAMFYRRALLYGLRLDTGWRIAGDYAFTLAVLRRAGYVIRTDHLVARFAPGGLSRRQAALGRREQFRIRRYLLRMPLLLAACIFLLQIVAASLRHSAPNGYAFWRFRGDCR
ncbi:glycosyltransferase [Niveispirillum sp. KHB5.9]|uniref:glycosyltransferase n=1 Tax=Niveispirillum sp. KHB5.9 TaxID=3400269 RepID=UPI003A8C0044